jgi:hypothetical protein
MTSQPPLRENLPFTQSYSHWPTALIARVTAMQFLWSKFAPTTLQAVRIDVSKTGLGIAPLLGWLNERSWPKLVDEHGLVTRGGKRIGWNEFSKITKVITNIGRTGNQTIHYELKHSNGKVVVAAYRLVDGDTILDYVWQHLPDQAKQSQS